MCEEGVGGYKVSIIYVISQCKFLTVSSLGLYLYVSSYFKHSSYYLNYSLRDHHINIFSRKIWGWVESSLSHSRRIIGIVR